jgi:hypothetical protein
VITRIAAVPVLLLAALVPGLTAKQAASERTAPVGAAQPLGDRALMNVVAFARLLGYVRHFHPSDEAAQTDWNAFAVEGMRAVEGAATVDALRRELDRLFRPIAPAVEIFAVSGRPSVPPAALSASDGTRLIAWRHLGYGAGGEPPYRSERLPITVAPPPLVASLGGGVEARIPLAVRVDDRGTLPRGAARRATAAAPAPALATDRAVRLAAAALAWNVLQHFYPYFDDVRTDWPPLLPLVLQQAAIDRTELDLADTLSVLIAGLRDGQARVTSPATAAIDAAPPLALTWVEGRLLVSTAAPATGLEPGDSIVSVNGAPAPLALEDQERTISGATPQWMRVRAIGQLLSGPPGSQLTLGVERSQASRRRETVTVTRQREPSPSVQPLPPVATLAEGVMYADLTRLDDKALDAALPRLAQAAGLVFDVRGDPAASDPHLLFRHLARAPLTSGQWLIPEVTRPDRVRMAFVPGPGWSFAPQAPYLGGRKVFLSDARAVGAAESYLEIVEHYSLGDIVGAPTAGTQGAPNRISLPGGFTVSFTGMRVLKHVGAPQHGIGIQPTVAVTRTRAAIAEGRDEVIARALEVLRAPR